MTTAPPGPERPALRRDAQANRARIVAAARELFAERGLNVGLNEVAHHACVGVGTVYRRFADKTELMRAALDDPLQAVLEVAAQADEAQRAWDGVELLLNQITDRLVDNLGLRDVALGGAGVAFGADVAQGIADVMERLFERARAEGDLRDGAVVPDVLMLLWLVTSLAEHAADVRPGLHRRYLQMLLDGMRAAPGRGPLREGLDSEEADLIAMRWAGR